LSQRITNQVHGLKGLNSKLLDIKSYLEKVTTGKLPINHQIIYQLQDVFNLLPDVNLQEFVKAFYLKTNDQMLVVYLASLIRSVVALHNLINNKIANRDAEKKEGQEKDDSKKEKKDEKDKDKDKEKGDATAKKDDKKEKKWTWAGMNLGLHDLVCMRDEFNASLPPLVTMQFKLGPFWYKGLLVLIKRKELVSNVSFPCWPIYTSIIRPTIAI